MEYVKETMVGVLDFLSWYLECVHHSLHQVLGWVVVPMGHHTKMVVVRPSEGMLEDSVAIGHHKESGKSTVMSASQDHYPNSHWRVGENDRAAAKTPVPVEDAVQRFWHQEEESPVNPIHRGP